MTRTTSKRLPLRQNYMPQGCPRITQQYEDALAAGQLGKIKTTKAEAKVGASPNTIAPNIQKEKQAFSND